MAQNHGRGVRLAAVRHERRCLRVRLATQDDAVRATQLRKLTTLHLGYGWERTEVTTRCPLRKAGKHARLARVSGTNVRLPHPIVITIVDWELGSCPIRSDSFTFLLATIAEAFATTRSAVYLSTREFPIPGKGRITQWRVTWRLERRGLLRRAT